MGRWFFGGEVFCKHSVDSGDEKSSGEGGGWDLKIFVSKLKAAESATNGSNFNSPIF